MVCIVGDEETSKKRKPPPCPLSWHNSQASRHPPPPPPPPQDPPPQDPPPPQQRNIRVDPPLPQQRNIRVSEGNVNDQHQDFHRQLALVHEEKAEEHKRRSQRACQHRLLLQRLVLLLLLCFVLGVLSQHYFPMDVSTDIFPTRSFQVDVSGVHDLVHAGVWGVLRAERKICLQQADGPLWSPARCRSFIFNLVYRA